MRSTLLLTAFLFAPAAPAQTFVVDASGGPGTHFTTIAAATAAVPSGSVLVVRPGTYWGFSIVAKSLTVNADPGVVVQVAASLPQVSYVEITQLAASDRVVLRGLSWRCPNGTFGSLSASDNDGLILVDGMDLVGGAATGFSFDDCDRVMIRDYRLNGAGWTSLSLLNSHAVVERCEFGPGAGFAVQAGAGVGATGGSLQLVDSRIGNGISWYTQGSAIHMQNADVRLLGSTELSGQNAFGAGSTWGVGITGQGTVRLAPTVTFVATSANFGPGVTPIVQPMPAMATTPLALGGTTTLLVHSAPSDLVVIFVALPGPRTLLPFFADPSWQDLATLIPLAAGTTGTAGTFAQPVTLPALAQLVVVSQAVALGASTGFAITNPSFVSLP